jgi:hypothetical protein
MEGPFADPATFLVAKEMPAHTYMVELLMDLKLHNYKALQLKF